VTGVSGTTRITATVYLQRKPVNGTYTTIKTWSGLSSNNLIFSFSDTHPVTSGFTYRLRLDATVTRNGTSESITVYSAERTP
jgi:hypothetical protein